MITKNIIGFDFSEGQGKYIQALDQVTGTFLEERFSCATSDDVHDASMKAHLAWPIFRSMPGKERAAFLNRIADKMELAETQISERIGLETAYPQARIKVEFVRTVNQLRMFAQYAQEMWWKDRWLDEAQPNRSPSPRPELRRVMMAVGPIVVFGASNFPLAYSTAGGDVASALCVGCPVIVKAHSSHLGTNALVAEIIQDAAKETGMPDGVFSSLVGEGTDIGASLVSHPLIAAVGFTGSLVGGRALFDLANRRNNPIPVFAEMGSVNPSFILPSALSLNQGMIAKQFATSLTMSAGQFCTKPGLLFVLNDEHTDIWINQLLEELKQVPPFTLLNPDIGKGFHKGIEQLNIEGVELIRSEDSKSQTVEPVLARTNGLTFSQHPFLSHEIFGPFGLIVVCDSFEEMVQIALNLEGQLTATIHASEEDTSRIFVLREILSEKAGRVIWNGVPTGVEVVHSMTHGGPYPASTDSRFTAVGHDSTRRWLRPVTFQNWPDHLLPSVYKS